jgi:hypothetical protein
MVHPAASKEATIAESIESVGNAAGLLATEALLRVALEEIGAKEAEDNFVRDVVTLSQYTDPMATFTIARRVEYNAQRYLDMVGAAIAPDANWPDREHFGLAAVKLELLRGSVAQDIAKERSPIVSLRAANQILAWTKGEELPSGQLDHFQRFDALIEKASEVLDLGPQPVRPN